MRDHHVRNPYKTCRLWRLLGAISACGPKILQKSIRFSVKVEVVLRLRKTSKKHWLHNVLELPEKLLKIPYKTCRLWRLLRPFSQNGSEKYQKSIRFIRKTEQDFAQSKNLIKPCENSLLQKRKSACEDLVKPDVYEGFRTCRFKGPELLIKPVVYEEF